MKTVDLTDNNLTDADLAQFQNIDLQAKGGKFSATTKQWTSPTKVVYHRLEDCKVEYDDQKVQEAPLEIIWRSYGFQKK